MPIKVMTVRIDEIRNESAIVRRAIERHGFDAMLEGRWEEAEAMGKLSTGLKRMTNELTMLAIPKIIDA